VLSRTLFARTAVDHSPVIVGQSISDARSDYRTPENQANPSPGDFYIQRPSSSLPIPRWLETLLKYAATGRFGGAFYFDIISYFTLKWDKWNCALLSDVGHISPPRAHLRATRSVPILGLTREYDSREIKIFSHRSLSREEALNPKSVRDHEDVRSGSRSLRLFFLIGRPASSISH
jgi:hypothetical protein